jgi:ATP-binding cassette subfamily B protein
MTEVASPTVARNRESRGGVGRMHRRTPRTPVRVDAVIDGGRPVRSMIRLVARRPGRSLLAVGSFALKDSPVWMMPVVTARIIDIVAGGGPVVAVLGWLGLAVVLLAQNYPSSLAFARMYMTIVRDSGADLRNALAERLQSLSIGYHTRASASVVQTKVVRDVENVELALQQVAQPLLSALFVLLGAIAMTAISVPQFLPVYALTVPIALLLRSGMARRSRLPNERFRREVEGFAARVGEMATLIPITRAHGLEETAKRKVAEGADDLRREGFSLDMLNTRIGSLSWVSMQLLGVACLGLAATASLTGFIPVTPGEVVLLATYFTLLTQGLTQLLMLLPVVARGAESLRSIAEVLREPDLESNEGKRQVSSVSGRIEVVGVSHRYPGSPHDAIRGLDLRIDPGEMVALVGSSGSGKSTLLNLILGFSRPTSGRILLDGHDMQELDLRSARRWVSVVPQESVLFEGTVWENVTYGLAEADMGRVEQAMRDAHALEIVDALPDGWQTVVGERGSRLSGGQRQRLAIARALVRDPRILLLDEATSALDPESEAKVRDALTSLVRGRTTLVVAHRLSTIRRADRIVVLERGRVVEIGTHEELLALSGRYSELYRLQMR